MKVSERDITRQFMNLLNESNDPNQFTGIHQAAGEVAGDVALDALGLGAFKKAAEVYQEIMSSRGGKKIEKSFPMMEVAGFARACALFISKLESFKKSSNMNEDIVTLFNKCLDECNVERYKLSETGQDAGFYPTVKSDS